MIHQVYLKADVFTSARKRLVKFFQEYPVIFFSYSGGKDSAVVSHLLKELIKAGKIDPSKLIVNFFDEEAIYPCVEKIVMQERKALLALGVKFYWWCLEFKHYNCLNQLMNDETFVCWDSRKKSVWCRPKPEFAINYHKVFKLGMNYQTWSDRAFGKYYNIIGIRANESVQRLSAFSKIVKNTPKVLYPIYDWKLKDVWLFVKQHQVPIPDAYIYLYKVGVSGEALRISQFFSIDTIRSLPKVFEFYPGLYEAILKREPNVELAALYFETDMFRSTRQNRKFDKKEDYIAKFKKEFTRAIKHPDSFPGFYHAKFLLRTILWEDPVAYKIMYQILVAGDPKKRLTRACQMHISGKHSLSKEVMQSP